jgi:hypothetical protein
VLAKTGMLIEVIATLRIDVSLNGRPPGPNRGD